MLHFLRQILRPEKKKKKNQENLSHDSYNPKSEAIVWAQIAVLFTTQSHTEMTWWTDLVGIASSHSNN